MNHHRDQSIDRMLRRRAGAPSLPVTSDCVDGELLAAWAARSLPLPEAARVERHLADCERCQGMMAFFVRTEPPSSTTATPWWQRLHVRWLVPLATAAVVAAVWVAVPTRQGEVPSAAQSAARDRALPNATQPLAAPQAEPSRREVVDALAVERAAQEARQRFADERATAGTVQRSTRVEKKDAEGVGTGAAARGAAPAAELRAAVPSQVPPLPPAAQAQGAVMSSPPPPSAPAQTPVAADKIAPLEEKVTVLAENVTITARAPAANIVTRSGRTRWRLIGGRQLQRSPDGGAEWHAVAFTPEGPLTGGHSPTPNVVWLVGGAGMIYVTSDGVSFARVPFVDSSDLVTVTAESDRHATITTADGSRWRTTDRGATWSRR